MKKPEGWEKEEVQKVEKVSQETKETVSQEATGKIICIMGESGSGKTTSLRNLDPKTTFYFDCDKKGLSWKGWREQYSVEKKNYCKTSEAKTITNYVKIISDSRPHIKTIVIDTLNGIMTDDEYTNKDKGGFGKWSELAWSIYGLLDVIRELRGDLNVICIIHSQTETDDNGYTYTRAKTNGRKLEKITVESKFNIVLLARIEKGKYVFETHANNSTAKTPLGAFETDTIPNDIAEVLEVLKEY